VALAATPARRRAVQGILDNTAAEIASLPNSSLRAVAPALHAARLELEKDLRRLLSQVDGDSKFTAQQYRNALVQLRGALEAIEKLDPSLAAILNKGTDTAGVLAVKTVQRDLASFSQIFDQTIKPIPLIAVNAIIEDNGRRTQIVRNKASAARYAGAVGDDIRKQLAIGMIRGENFRQLTKRLIGPGSGIDFSKISGTGLASLAGAISDKQFRRYQAWASRIVRTEILNAYNGAADDTIEALNQLDHRIMRRWNAANDARTCAQCAGLEGEVVPNDSDFSGGIYRPPAHPNCRCGVCAWRSDWEEQSGAHYGKHVDPADIPKASDQPYVDPDPTPSRAAPDIAGGTGTPRAPKAPPVSGQAASAAPAGPTYPIDPAELAKAMEAKLSKGTGAWAELNRGMRNVGDELNQKKIRDGLRKLLERYKMVDRDTGVLNFVSGKTRQTNGHNAFYSASASAMGRGVMGYHVSTAGAMVILDFQVKDAALFLRAKAVGRAATDAEASAMHTLVHESIHGMSPLTMRGGGYGAGTASIIEEVATELSARKVMRETFTELASNPNFHPPIHQMDINPKRAYDSYILKVGKIVQEETKLPHLEVMELLEHAGLGTRSTADECPSMVSFVQKFLEHMPVERSTREIKPQDLRDLIARRIIGEL
jgi:SPP1 gp7 family putative phage head morphogenesis protein